MLQYADRETADDVDEHDHNAGYSIAAHEFAGAVHGAVKLGFERDHGAALARFVFADKAGIEVGVDRHLLAGHGVQSETRGHFRDAARALGDHHEIDEHQYREYHDADCVIAADQEMTKGLDHLARGVGAGVALQQHDPSRSDVERQA